MEFTSTASSFSKYSENGESFDLDSIQIGLLENQGPNGYMQDASLILRTSFALCLAVCDGHGSAQNRGELHARFTLAELKILLEQPESEATFSRDPFAFMAEFCRKTNKTINDSFPYGENTGGTTFVLYVITPKCTISCKCGDSEIFVFRQPSAPTFDSPLFIDTAVDATVDSFQPVYSEEGEEALAFQLDPTQSLDDPREQKIHLQHGYKGNFRYAVTSQDISKSHPIFDEHGVKRAFPEGKECFPRMWYCNARKEFAQMNVSLSGNHYIAMARSLGDQQTTLPIPTLTVSHNSNIYPKGVTFVIICSDGFSDSLTNKDMRDFLYTPENLAKLSLPGGIDLICEDLKLFHAETSQRIWGSNWDNTCAIVIAVTNA